jgi:hypothetical protein
LLAFVFSDIWQLQTGSLYWIFFFAPSPRTMASKGNDLPNFTGSDYVKFFSAGALAATSTHAVGYNKTPQRRTGDAQCLGT